uniref:Phosphomannomutase n=1 Tax=viral metagenome TaxID=1070528 RepID=A0A6C0LG91_9ZZZZ
MKKLFLFDVDGTIAESGQKINKDIAELLNNYFKNSKTEIGIVGGGKLDRILWQTEDVRFNHYFSECGCVYNKLVTDNNKLVNNNNHSPLSLNNSLNLIYEKNIREHSLYNDINILIKLALKFLSDVDYTLTGNFIDLRTGIIYISLIGLNANEDERNYFKELDEKLNYRKRLLDILQNKALDLNIYNKIHIVYGGSVGIAIYPSEHDKKQIMNHINHNDYSEIHYFGDKYLQDGNDYLLLHHEFVIGHKVYNVSDTYKILKNLLNK